MSAADRKELHGRSDARTTKTLDELAETVAGARYLGSNESELQDGIASVLTIAGTKFEREYRLTKKDRLDFWVPRSIVAIGLLNGRVERGIALEVKANGGLSDVVRQLHRYAAHESVLGLLLVTTRSQHRRLHCATMTGKPVRVVVVGGAFA